MARSSAVPSRTPGPGKKIQVRFATNRNQTEGDALFGASFRNAPDDSLFVTGTIDVYHRGGSPHPNWVPDPKSLHLDPTPTAASSSIPKAVAAARSTSDAMTAFIEDRLQAEAKRGKPKSSGDSGIVFLPGFDNTFISSMSSSAEIASAYGASDVFCFSWPSQGEFGLGPYVQDRSAAYASGNAIALSLSVMFSKLLGVAKSKRPNLHIVCHSMGTRALSAAIQNISISVPKLLSTNYFEYALLLAADEDYDALDEPNKLKSLLTLATNIDVYTNDNDAAMFLSGVVNLHSPLGSFGPANFGRLSDKVIWIDCTDVGSTNENDGSSDFGHQYYRLSEPVTADVHQVLLGTAPDKVAPRIPDSQFPKRKFVIPFSVGSAWARSRGYEFDDVQVRGRREREASRGIRVHFRGISGHEGVPLAVADPVAAFPFSIASSIESHHEVQIDSDHQELFELPKIHGRTCFALRTQISAREEQRSVDVPMDPFDQTEPVARLV